MDPKTYTLDDLPQDAQVNTGQPKEYDPIDPSEMYQVEISKVTFQDNPYYKPEAEKAEERGSKYQLSFEFSILGSEEFVGRRLWRKTSLSLMPMTKKGEPTILYKIVCAALNQEMSWDECGEFAKDISSLMANLTETIVGKQVKVAIENVTNPETKKVKSTIKAFYPVKTAIAKPDPVVDVELDDVIGILDQDILTDVEPEPNIKAFYRHAKVEGLDPKDTADKLAAYLGKGTIGGVDPVVLKGINLKLDKGLTISKLFESYKK